MRHNVLKSAVVCSKVQHTVWVLMRGRRKNTQHHPCVPGQSHSCPSLYLPPSNSFTDRLLVSINDCLFTSPLIFASSFFLTSFNTAISSWFQRDSNQAMMSQSLVNHSLKTHLLSLKNDFLPSCLTLLVSIFIFTSLLLSAAIFLNAKPHL